jgi:hypothetical protein
MFASSGECRVCIIVDFCKMQKRIDARLDDE